MTKTSEQILEQAYVLIAHLAALRLDLQPHSARGPLTSGQRLAFANLLEALRPITPADMNQLAASMRGFAAAGLGYQPDPADRGEIIDMAELLKNSGLTDSPASLMLIRALQQRCEEITGDRNISALWGPSGESMRAVLTVGGVRVSIMEALRTLDGMLHAAIERRAAELIETRLDEHIQVVQDVLAHAADRLKVHFGDPDAEWNAAEKVEASQPVTHCPPGYHACLQCSEVYMALELHACPSCGHPRPTWYSAHDTSKAEPL